MAFWDKWINRNQASPNGEKVPPHVRWPEILDWRSGDEFDTHGWRYFSIRLISITEDGGAYCDVNYRHKAYLKIAALVGTNISLRDRKLSARIKSSNEYMELLDAFHKSVDELKARDATKGIQ